MATKVTAAIVATLAFGALITANHEVLARGGGFGGGGLHGGGFGGRGVFGGGFRGGGVGFHSGFGHGFGFGRGFGYGRHFGFYGGYPYFYGGMDTAAVRITTPTGAIEH